jgi:hypothetical protein
MLVLGVPAAALADAKQVRYVGVHPVAKSDGGGMCYIEGPHVHVYEADELQYRDYKGHKHFVGDPVAYGYEGPKHAYKGHHPIHVHAVVGAPEPHVEFCYLDGEHFHPYAAPQGPEFQVQGGAYFYVGTPPQVYVDARPRYVGINAIYTPIVYARPAVVVQAPAAWIHARPGFAVGVAVGAGVAVGGGIVVGGPAVVVRPPSVQIGVGVNVGVGVGVGVRPAPGRYKYKKPKRKF